MLTHITKVKIRNFYYMPEEECNIYVYDILGGHKYSTYVSVCYKKILKTNKLGKKIFILTKDKNTKELHFDTETKSPIKITIGQLV